MNDEMVMKRRGGTKIKIVVERMLNVFFNLHFPTPAVEAMSRIYACKTGRNLQIFGWCLQFKQSCPVGYTILLLSAKTKQGNQRNEASRLRKCIKKELSVIIRLECEEVSLQIEFITLPPKNHNLFVRKRNEKGVREKGIAATG